MTRKFPHVSSPITIGRTTFRNRIFSAPMGGTDYYQRRLYRSEIDGLLRTARQRRCRSRHRFRIDGPSPDRWFPRLPPG